MNDGRASGILLHPTSLPAPLDGHGRARDAGSGDFGAAARRFIEWLASAGQGLWQVLPFNPVGPGFSPYTSPSAHAGNPLLIAPDELAALGLLDSAMLAFQMPYSGCTVSGNWPMSYCVLLCHA